MGPTQALIHCLPGFKRPRREVTIHLHLVSRLSWNLSGFYAYKNERKQIAVNQTGVQIQQETFLFNTNLALSQQNAEIYKMQEMITDDKEIIHLQENVKNVTQTQLENGTATTNDYLIAVNAEDQARQNRILHVIQLIMYQYNAKTTAGNWELKIKNFWKIGNKIVILQIKRKK